MEEEEQAGLAAVAYKAMADSVEKTMDRRQSANNFFITMNLAVSAGYAFMVQESKEGLFGLGSLVGTITCGLWLLTLIYYKELSAAKFQMLGEFEKKHRIIGYQSEWEIFSSKSVFDKAGVSLSTIEQIIAAISLVGHLAAPYLLTLLT
jgi:hypothetical protein